ncbi:hypothetical protein BP6252_11140 [Coleophoma cylindrospora]|uniref:FAD dependent oxidoreductase domain-containing protein n=1 Tax=Coleophoma cylindrospora TaxID=1849047 RepID=A0A3D8QP64_9HELO|nr:hypothetical protein BP6252_11140 [Coleophoma cylindrospora]
MAKSLIVVGAGVFGVSSALAWRRRYPDASVTLIDPKPLNDKNPEGNWIVPTSEDTGKIIRTAYVSSSYTELAKEAIGMWEVEEPYLKYWRKSGWVVPEKIEAGSLNKGTDMSRERFFELFPNALLEDDEILKEDKSPGWVEASAALAATIQTAIREGVNYVPGEAAGLLWNVGTCIGVKLGDGTEFRADFVVLAMGCWTKDFLQQSGVTSHGVNCEVAGITVLGIQLNEREYEQYKDMPMIAIPEKGEILPPTRDGVIKTNNAISFHAPDLSSRKIPLILPDNHPYFEENIAMLAKYFPGLKHAPIAFRRYCFDAFTPKQDFIISALPGYEGLHVATGGSFHGWKFLPNIGNYVADMLEGKLAADWVDKWAIGAKLSAEFIHPDIIPKRSAEITTQE